MSFINGYSDGIPGPGEKITLSKSLTCSVKISSLNFTVSLHNPVSSTNLARFQVNESWLSTRSTLGNISEISKFAG
jgi:hypothetical protein